MAAVRFRNFNQGTRAVDGTIVGESATYALQGWIDFTNQRGYARVAPSDSVPPFLAVWDATGAAVYTGDVEELMTDPAPTGGWVPLPLSAESGPVPKALLSLILLASDRPDNPQLLRQNGARYLGTEHIDGDQAEHYSGPTVPDSGADQGAVSDQTQYWVDPQTGLLVQFATRLDAVDDLSSFLFSDQATMGVVPAPGDVLDE